MPSVNTENGNSSEDSGEVHFGATGHCASGVGSFTSKGDQGLTVPPDPAPADQNDDLLVGAAAIGRFLGANTRRAFYLLETRQVPAFKLLGGRLWHARRSTLVRFMEDQERVRSAPSQG